MKPHEIVTIGIAALVLTAGAVAAAPGNAPADAQPDDSDQPGAAAGGPDAADGENESAADAENESANGSDAASAAADDRQGPPGDAPDSVPDHVIEIHQQIDEFLNGDGDFNLGETVSGIASGGEQAESEERDEGDADDEEDADETDGDDGEGESDDEDAEA